MSEQEEMRQTLKEKAQLLRQFEAATQRMLTCPVEQMEEEVQIRDRLIRQMEQGKKRMAALCGDGEYKQAMLELLDGRVDLEKLPEEYVGLHEEGLQIRAVASRIRESDAQAGARLQLEQQRILEQIKAANQSPNAKAAKFHYGQTKTTTSGRLGRA